MEEGDSSKMVTQNFSGPQMEHVGAITGSKRRAATAITTKWRKRRRSVMHQPTKSQVVLRQSTGAPAVLGLPVTGTTARVPTDTASSVVGAVGSDPSTPASSRHAATSFTETDGEPKTDGEPESDGDPTVNNNLSLFNDLIGSQGSYCDLSPVGSDIVGRVPEAEVPSVDQSGSCPVQVLPPSFAAQSVVSSGSLPSTSPGDIALRSHPSPSVKAQVCRNHLRSHPHTPTSAAPTPLAMTLALTSPSLTSPARASPLLGSAPPSTCHPDHGKSYDTHRNTDPTSIAPISASSNGRMKAEGSSERRSSEIPAAALDHNQHDGDNMWLLTSPSPGGPHLLDVIPSFGGHIARVLWENPATDRGVLTMYTQKSRLDDLRCLELTAEGAIELIQSTGLFHLRDCMFKDLDKPLLSAFIERWQPDTNTFHMPFGEMSMLLHDVWHILRIPVDGQVCGMRADAEMAPDEVQASIRTFLGISEAAMRLPWDISKSKAVPYKGGTVYIDAIRSVTVSSPVAEIVTQGYLLMLLGATLFVDKSGDRVKGVVNLFLKDVKKVKGYAWGAGALAFLYRQLGIASRAETRGIAGCLTLLQAWIYEYFPMFRPTSEFAQHVDDDAPRVLMWGRGRSGSKNDCVRLRQYRAMLDELLPEQVMWLPYGTNPSTEVPRTRYVGCIRFSDIIEPYSPDRCLRQLGYTQRIPAPIIIPTRHYRPAKPHQYEVIIPGFSNANWVSLSYHALNPSEFVPADPPSSVSDDYMDWYRLASHPYIIKPTNAAPSVRNLNSRQQLATHSERRDEGLKGVVALIDRLRVDGASGLDSFLQAINEFEPVLREFRTT